MNALLVEAGLLDPAASPIIGLVVESNCSFFSSLAFPDSIEVGVTVEALGRSSVRYLLAVFKAGAEAQAAAQRALATRMSMSSASAKSRFRSRKGTGG